MDKFQTQISNFKTQISIIFSNSPSWFYFQKSRWPLRFGWILAGAGFVSPPVQNNSESSVNQWIGRSESQKLWFVWRLRRSDTLKRWRTELFRNGDLLKAPLSDFLQLRRSVNHLDLSSFEVAGGFHNFWIEMAKLLNGIRFVKDESLGACDEKLLTGFLGLNNAGITI